MGVLEINGGVRTRPFFYPFPALLSREFVKKLYIFLSSCSCSPAFT